jgi:transcription elongation factor GreA
MEALSQFLPRLKEDEQRDGRQELNRFIQWCGRDRGTDELTPQEVAEYAESAGMWGANSTKKLKPVKSFLSYLKTKGLTNVSLAPHLKATRPKKEQRRVYIKAQADRAELSPEGYANLQSRLEMLLEERKKVTGDIQRAMADKDFRENAPLEAAKERQGLIESNIRDLESILSNATVTAGEGDNDHLRIRIGKTVTLRDTSSGKGVRYKLVDSRESDPVSGKISSVSPVGKALLDKVIGEEVQIAVPSGTLSYIIEKIER